MRNQFTFTERFDSPLFDRDAVAAFAGRVEAANERMLDFVVDANRRFVDAAVTSADRAAEVLPALPFADRLPTPAESGARYLDFVERAAAMNREFNQRVLARLAVDTPAVVDPAVEAFIESVASEQSAEKTVAEQSPTTKTAATKTAATKTAAKRSAATQSAATKAAARKSTAKKTATKRAAAKKTAAPSGAASN